MLFQQWKFLWEQSKGSELRRELSCSELKSSNFEFQEGYRRKVMVTYIFALFKATAVKLPIKEKGDETSLNY